MSEAIVDSRCVYQAEARGDGIHTCYIYGQCTTGQGTPDLLSCRECNDRLWSDDPQFASRWRDPLVVIDRQRKKIDSLRGMLAGRAVFLLGGGPSVNDLPLEKMLRRGVWTMAVNNAAGHPRIRPQAFVCSDPPNKFSHSIWLDPGIMKFIPSPKMNGRRSRIRKKVGGVFLSDKRWTLMNCPNVWGFKRASWLTPDDGFFLTDGACWGNHESGVQQTGQPKTVCTMLLGLRLLYYLGAKRIYLLGVDFRMEPDRVYSFDENKHVGGCDSNNRQFAVVNGWLCEMQEKGVFRKFGLEVFNCYQESGLRAFPYVPFDQAIIDVCGEVEEAPDLRDWYVK